MNLNMAKNVYDYSPIFMQNMLTSFAGHIKNRSRYGKGYYEYREFLIKFDKLSLDQKLKYQQQELVNFVHYAYENSPFYNELYSKIDMNEIQTVSDLKKLPIVDKEMLRSNIEDVNTIPKKGAVVAKTGGTTGKSLEVLMTKEDMMKRMAQWDHFKARVGFENLKMRKATFNGQHIIPSNQKSKKFWRYNAATKQMIYSPFYITEENMKYYIDSLNRFKPHVLDGFFTSILDVANYIERHRIELEFRPIAIFPTSETLTDTGRDTIERVFQCKVYNQYASSEGAPFITECNNQKLHVELASGVFEQFEESSNEVLVTSFTTHGTPLIRYQIGDSVVFDESINCDCGNKSPIVREIQGRKLDYLYASNGAIITSANVANIFKDIPNSIIRGQLIQDEIGTITVLIEIDPEKYQVNYDKLLTKEIKLKFGNKTTIVIKHVDQIPREKSGKYSLIKNRVDE